MLPPWLGMRKKSDWSPFAKRARLLHVKYNLRVIMSDKPYLYPAIIEQNENGYLVSILKDNPQNENSYVEFLVKEGDPLYPRIHSAVCTLNISGELEEIENVGAMYSPGMYHIVLTEEERNDFIKYP